MRPRTALFRVEALWKIIRTEFKQCFVFCVICQHYIPTKNQDCLTVVLYMTGFGALNVLWQ